MNRRAFFQNGGRWMLLGGIGIFAGWLALNNKVSVSEECNVSPVCSNCRLFKGCKLPQAKKQREDGK
jgi:hypothetical protein